MKVWKTAALSAALLGAAAAGAAIAPVAHGQSSPTRVITPRNFEVFTTGGGRLGVSVADIDASESKASSGVVIESVESDSPAEKAGLKTGDIVVEFDGERVRSVRQFTRLVSETPAGRQVAAAVLRDGQRVSLNLTTRSRSFGGVGDFSLSMPPLPARPARPARPSRLPRPAPTPRPPSIERFVWAMGNQLGVTANTLSDQLAEFFGTKHGVLVASVTDGSAADKAGVKAGDVIVSMNGKTVEDPADLRRHVLDAESGDEFTLGVIREKKSVTLKGKLESNTTRRATRTL